MSHPCITVCLTSNLDLSLHHGPSPLKDYNYKLSTPPPRSSSQSEETSAAALCYKSLTMPFSSTQQTERHQCSSEADSQQTQR